jgi:hypothetical protein
MWMLCCYVRISAPGEHGTSRTESFSLCVQLLLSTMEVVWIVFGVGALLERSLFFCASRPHFKFHPASESFRSIGVDKLPREASYPTRQIDSPLLLSQDNEVMTPFYMHFPSCTVCSSDSHDIRWCGASFSKHFCACG